MPDMSGLELQQALQRSGHDRPIIFLTGRGDVPTSVHAMKQGALDFLTKPVDGKDLIAAVAAAIERDSLIRRERAAIRSIEARLATLTPRESEVLSRVVAGRLNKQIAADLGTAEKTVKVHRARVMAKMGVRTVADLVRITHHAGVTGKAR
jgi:FixJ family two-component response regulator